MKTKMRGLEPVVAAVLLIVVAVIGAVLVYPLVRGLCNKSHKSSRTDDSFGEVEDRSCFDNYCHKRRHVAYPQPRWR